MLRYKSIYLPVLFLFFSISIFFIFLSSSVNATNHYVDKNADGNNNGTSWGNAWESFSDIEWNQIQPGDTLFISGGSDSTVYNEQLNVSASGTALNLITIRAGLDAGHNGRVILDGEGSVGHGVSIDKYDYIRIVELEFKRHIGRGSIFINGRSYDEAQVANCIYIDSCKITEIQGHAGIFIGGYPADSHSGCDSIFIRYNTIIAGQSSSQTDCIYAQRSENIFIDHNTLIEDNEVSTSHCDGIQFVWIKNATVSNNYLYVSTNELDRPNQGMMFEHLAGEIVVYNNVVYAPNYYSYHNNIIDKDYHHEHSWTFISNTVYGGSNYNLVNLNSPNITCKNNIFYNSATPRGGSVRYVQTPYDWSLTDGNLYGTYQVVTIGGRTMTEINILGGERTGRSASKYLVNPKFVRTGPYGSEDLAVKSNSPCINAGVDLPPPYDVDINGVIRPQGKFTIGAYQYEP